MRRPSPPSRGGRRRRGLGPRGWGAGLMAGKNIAARPASWRVLYVDSAGQNRVSTVTSQAKVDALVAELAGQESAGVKATAAAWRAFRRRCRQGARQAHFARELGRPGWLDAQTTAAVTGTYVVPNARGDVQGVRRVADLQVFRPSTAALVELALRKRVYPAIGAKALGSISNGDPEARGVPERDLRSRDCRRDVFLREHGPEGRRRESQGSPDAVRRDQAPRDRESGLSRGRPSRSGGGQGSG